MLKIKHSIAVAVAALAIIGCGGGGGTPPSNNTNPPATNPPSSGGGSDNGEGTNQSLNRGIVSDGYIAGANVLIDINTTTVGKYDKGDINLTTNSKGNFEVPSDTNVSIGTFIYASGGKNVATGEDFNGTLKGVYSGQETISLTPLTTMVAAQLEENTTATAEDIEAAKEKVAQALGIPKDKVEADPVEDKDALKAVQKVVTVAKVLNSASDNNKSLSDVIEDIAKKIKIKDDSNISKAVEEVAQDITDADENTSKDLAQLALKSAEAVEQVIKETNSSNETIENLVQEHIVTKVVKHIKEAKESNGTIEVNLTKVESDLNETINTITDTSFEDVLAAADCLTFDKIKGENNSSDSVTKDLNISGKSACEESNVSIEWIAFENVESNGSVSQEKYKDKIATIEANISKNDKSLTKAIVMTIPALGHKPTANNDIVTVNEDNNITIDVLANDIDKDGLSEDNITITTPPSHGNATVENNKIIYTPDENYIGSDSLVYTLQDPLGAEANATVNITVIPVNDAPVLEDIADINVSEDSTIHPITLTATDADENDTITFSASSSDSSILDVNVSNGILSFILKPDAFGSVTITVTATDSQGASNSKSFTVNISPINDAPVLGNLPTELNVTEDSNLTIPLSATDVDGDALTFSAASSNHLMSADVVNGELLIIPTPNIDYGDATITVTVSDGNLSDSKDILVNIMPVNDAPVLANIDNVTINEDSPAIEVELNATDPDSGDSVTYSATATGNLVDLNVSGNKLTIHPKPDAFGSVTITVTATDSQSASDSKTFNLTINPVNDAPKANNDSFTISSKTNAILDVLANDSDIEDDNLTIVSVETPSEGNVSIVNNKLLYTPNIDFNGTVSFKYTISDGEANATATVTLNIEQYVAAITKAIDTATNYDLENGSLDTLLSDLETILNTEANSSDAQVGLAIIDLAQTLDDELSALVDGNDDILDKLLKHQDIAIELINNFAGETETSLSNTASKFRTLSAKIDSLFSDPNYEFKYGSLVIKHDDAKALSGALMLIAAKLEYMAAYHIVDDEYINIKTAEINGITYEYREIKVNPIAVLNNPTTLSLNSSAQSHFDQSKADLQSAINKIASVNIDEIDTHIQSKLDSIQSKLSDINASLNGTRDLVIKDMNISLSALFNENSALTLSNSLGNNWEYQIYDKEHCKYDYNLSIEKNKVIVSCETIYNEGNQTVTDKYYDELNHKKITPKAVPQNNNIPKIIKAIKKDNKTYSGNDILKALFGNFEVETLNWNYEYSDPSDVNITYKIIDGNLGSTAPYECNLTYIHNYNWEEEVSYEGDEVGILTKTSSNECKLSIKNNIRGNINYQILITDNYGHKKYIWDYINIDFIADETPDEGDGNYSIPDENTTNEGDMNNTEPGYNDNNNTEGGSDNNASEDECQNYNPITGKCEDNGTGDNGSSNEGNYTNPDENGTNGGYDDNQTNPGGSDGNYTDDGNNTTPPDENGTGDENGIPHLEAQYFDINASNFEPIEITIFDENSVPDFNNTHIILFGYDNETHQEINITNTYSDWAGTWSIEENKIKFTPNDDFEGGEYVVIGYKLYDNQDESYAKIYIKYPLQATVSCDSNNSGINSVNELVSNFTTKFKETYNTQKRLASYSDEIGLKIDPNLFESASGLDIFENAYQVKSEVRNDYDREYKKYKEANLSIDMTNDSFRYSKLKYKYEDENCTVDTEEINGTITQNGDKYEINVGNGAFIAQMKSVKELNGTTLQNIFEDMNISITIDSSDKAYITLFKNPNPRYDWWENDHYDDFNYSSLDEFISAHTYNSTNDYYDKESLSDRENNNWRKALVFDANSSANGGILNEIDKSNNQIIAANAGSWERVTLDDGEEIIIVKPTLCGYEDRIYKFKNGKIVRGNYEPANRVSAEIYYSESLRNKLKAIFDFTLNGNITCGANSSYDNNGSNEGEGNYSNPDENGSGDTNGTNNNSFHSLEKNINESEYNTTNASDPTPLATAQGVYKVKGQRDDLTIEKIEINSNSITVSKCDENLSCSSEGFDIPYSINNDNEIVINFTADNNETINANLKFINSLSGDEINDLLGETIFSDDDTGYLIYQKELNDDGSTYSYEKKIWLNYNAAVHYINYIKGQNNNNDMNNSNENNNPKLPNVAKDNANNDVIINQTINGNDYTFKVYTDSTPSSETSQDTIAIYVQINNGDFVSLSLNSSYPQTSKFQIVVYDNNGNAVASTNVVDYDELSIDAGNINL